MTGKNSGLEISVAANLAGADALAEPLSKTIPQDTKIVTNRVRMELLIRIDIASKRPNRKHERKGEIWSGQSAWSRSRSLCALIGSGDKVNQ